MPRFAFPSLATLLVIALLGGCSALLLREDFAALQLPTEWTARREALQKFERFELAGRLAIVRGESGGSAALRWQQRGEESTLEIQGPMGLAANRFRYRPGEEHAWRELEAQLGFALPAGSLRYWLLGVPDPRVPATEQHAPEQQDDSRQDDSRQGAMPVLRGLEQSGWQLEFVDYAALSPAGLRLPARIEARSVDARGEPIRVRVLIQRWSRLP